MKFVDTKKSVTEITLEELVRLYVNHRPGWWAPPHTSLVRIPRTSTQGNSLSCGENETSLQRKSYKHNIMNHADRVCVSGAVEPLCEENIEEAMAVLGNESGAIPTGELLHLLKNSGSALPLLPPSRPSFMWSLSVTVASCMSWSFVHKSLCHFPHWMCFVLDFFWFPHCRNKKYYNGIS